MTRQQAKLYRAPVRISKAFPTGGATWTGVRTDTAGVETALSSRAIRFAVNGLTKEQQAMAGTAVFSSPYWGVADASIDIQAGDVYTDGEIAFLVAGEPDTSQGFQLIPAERTTMPDDPQTSDGWSL